MQEIGRQPSTLLDSEVLAIWGRHLTIYSGDFIQNEGDHLALRLQIEFAGNHCVAPLSKTSSSLQD